MVAINVAYTAPINPTGAAPSLTQAQVWEGLRRKVRRAQDFVPVIEACEVLQEEADEEGNERVVREVRFAAGAGPEKSSSPVREVCVHHAPARVDFQQEDGSTIANIVSRDPAGALLMTYSFEWRHPGLEAGSARAAELEESHWKMAKMAVEQSIDSIRRLVKEGVIT